MAGAGLNAGLPVGTTTCHSAHRRLDRSVIFFLFAIASIPPTCFCAFIAGNSFSTMIPGVPRVASTMAGARPSVFLAVTGVAANLIGFFTIVGASFGPICGAMAADYLLSGKKWAGPREGVNMAGYIAWALGFLVGILPFVLPAHQAANVQPAVLYSFVTGLRRLRRAGKDGAPAEGRGDEVGSGNPTRASE